MEVGMEYHGKHGHNRNIRYLGLKLLENGRGARMHRSLPEDIRTVLKFDRD